MPYKKGIENLKKITDYNLVIIFSMFKVNKYGGNSPKVTNRTLAGTFNMRI